tara:strand:+ start:454 stop:954 length:501 start_codon:yes stop_codon:yes gene_type:complete
MNSETVAFVVLYVAYIIASIVCFLRKYISSEFLNVKLYEARLIVGIEFLTILPWTYAIAETDHKIASGLAAGAAANLLIWLYLAYKKDSNKIFWSTLLSICLFVAASGYAIHQDRFAQIIAILLIAPHLLHRVFVDGIWLYVSIQRQATKKQNTTPDSNQSPDSDA